MKLLKPVPLKILSAIGNARITNKELAQKCGVSIPAISRILNGVKAKPITVGKLAYALGVAVEQIIDNNTED